MSTDFGALCDTIATKQAAIDKANLKHKEKMKPLEAEVEDLEQELLVAMKEAKLLSVTGRQGEATIKEKTRVSFADFAVFAELVYRKKLAHLFERRISVKAYEELKKSMGNKPVPGLSEYVQETLSVTKKA
jgi:hypothetical protein